MTIAVKALIDSAATQLYDPGFTTWSNDELIGWLREGLGALAEVRADLFTKVLEMDLVTGVRQAAPDDVEQITNVLGFKTATGASFVGATPFDMATMDAAYRLWRGTSAPVQRQFSIMKDDRVFFVYPGAAATPGRALIEALVLPSVPPAGGADYATATIELDARFTRCLLDYILYRAFMKDADEGGPQRVTQATRHYTAFMDGTGRSAVMAEQQAANANGKT